MFETHQYDLSFVIPPRTQTAPEIVFSINLQHLPELQERLGTLAQRFHEHFTEYLGQSNTKFELFNRDLFATTFGYGGCGYLTTDHIQGHLHLRLCSGAGTLYASATMLLMTMSLGWAFETETKSNQCQAVILETSAVHRLGGWGHAVHGYLSRSVMEWVKACAKLDPNSKNEGGVSRLPEEVLQSMNTAWEAVTEQGDGTGIGKNYINGWIRQSGAFSLICWGDACDLSVYPDQVNDELEEITQFSCHNLDTSKQQLTLLAGLAKICQLSRERS